MAETPKKRKLYEPLHLPYPHNEYDGVPMPIFIPKQRMEEIETSHRSRPSDVFIATYPKSGTTWLQHVVNEILGRPQGDTYERISDAVPWLAAMPQTHFDEMKSPRLMKSHDKWEWIPKEDGVKYIACVRNPKDVAVSLYHHMLMINGIYDHYEATFEEFMADVFMPRVGVEFGYYFDHVAGWLGQRNNPNVLLLSYEDMVENLGREVQRISEFLCVDLSEEAVAEIASSGSFSSMKQSTKLNYSWLEGTAILGKSNFIRKGKVGDWRNYLSDEHSRELESLVEKHLKPLGGRIRYTLNDD